MSDFLIIGGGAIGLLQARELALAGASVTLVERGRCGQEASWAGGGIVSPLYPWRYSQPVTALARWAQDFYPRLAITLREETGIDPELVQTGLLMLDAGEEAEALRWAEGAGRPMEPVTPAFIYGREPQLAEGFNHGLWMADIANIRNPRLIKALVQSLHRMPGVQIREECEVIGFRTRGSRVTGVAVSVEGKSLQLPSDQVVVTAGAWSGRLLRECGLALQVHPVKGQMLLYFSSRSLIQSMVLHAGRYLIPRKDGHILVGSTLEQTGFDKNISATARDSLQTCAAAILPELGRMEPLRQWAGLRPGTEEGIPYIGQLPGYENLHVNAGHFRNGLVLAPASAHLLADLLLDREPIIDPAPYHPAYRLIQDPVS
jgi:glycine oxidase